MRFTVARDTFLAPLSQVIGVVERKQTLPVLANLLIEANDEGVVRLTGTDLEVEISSATQFPVEESGAITVAARKLYDICRNLPETSELVLATGEDKLTVRSGKSRFSLATMPADEFPRMERSSADTEVSISTEQLKELIEGSQFAMAIQDVRYFLNGLLLELSDRSLRAVATDGHRLAMSETALGQSVDALVQAIVPRKAVQELLRLLTGDGNTVLGLSENQLVAECGGSVLISKLVDGRFPDYTKVIPTGAEHQVMVERDLIRSALTRAAILSNEKYRGVRVKVGEGILTMQANNPEHEEAEETIEVAFEGDGFEIGFNVNYLLEALTALRSDTAVLSLRDGQSSALVTGEGDDNRRYVVMPMRL